jgi:tripartite-type tricarboxylate transporter receptor subunit TctC
MTKERMKDFPDVPAATEFGCDITLSLWRGIGINKKVPEDIKNYLTQVIDGACQSPEYKEFLISKKANPEGLLTGKKAHDFYLDIYNQVKTAYEELKGSNQ